ncbi:MULTISPECIES: kynureninase [unclassified Undibacterium]|uniref:kynureninase n=1 Tax=unclassified Undibacterium TaxID=2630295 RepID=UPI002AC95602|nr:MULTISPECIES: kynureninase [unclassified Undibacterium]MEB0138422.1 kynureninase [Undibacterium sp. CCC2.1]MEB0171297.1 kynureninase [Undibacterium sp. CCC1.1]MEB0176465.1 kynureninase [Undibacterium sp. CCC3.4]MEB0214051.1 kynureninase [Undibacterium sp. 5I2]WPX45704.1 kynureninase [Undibacterium sp. CCC3.4]
MLTRDDCEQLDRDDALAALRNEFLLPPEVIYLDGNSLGARPKAALERARQVIADEWGQDLIKSWNSAGWFDLPSTLGDQLAPLIGAAAGEVVVTDSTSINLFKAIAAALQMQAADSRRKTIITERSNFPTDIYMAEGLTRWLDRGYRLVLIDQPEQLAEVINEETALVMLTHVNYRSGYLHDMTAVTALIHAHGALALWDLAHSAGAVPVTLNAAAADFAVGCTYKYLNGGPGAPAFIWVPARHQAAFSHPLSGWWGHASPFAMEAGFTPTPGIRRALCGTQPMLSLALVGCGLDVFGHTDMTAIRAKSLALTDLFINLVEARCAAHGLELVTPRAHAQRGSHASFKHPHAYALIQALIGRGIIGDYREPAVMRFGFTPLYLRFVDVWDAVEGLRDILDHAAYDTDLKRNAVT